MQNINDAIVVPLSKVKLALWLALALVLNAAGVELVFCGWPVRGGGAVAALIIGIVLLLVFGLCLFYLTRKLFDQRPGLVIDADGIVDNSSWLAPGRMAWRDINHITERRVFSMSRRFAVVFVHNPNEYIENQRHWLKRKLMRANFMACGSPFAISTTALKISYDQLLPLMLQIFNKYKVL